MNEHVIALMLNEIEKFLTGGCYNDDCKECIWYACESDTCNLEEVCEKNLKEMLP